MIFSQKLEVPPISVGPPFVMNLRTSPSLNLYHALVGLKGTVSDQEADEWQRYSQGFVSPGQAQALPLFHP